jgi:hypothetical protein
MAIESRRIGDAVDSAVKDATESWYAQHGGARSREEAFANDLRLLSATVERRPGGRLGIHVGLVTGDRRSTESYYYQLIKKNGCYRELGPRVST